MRYLAEQQIPVEVCISSNVMTGCCASLDQHPVRKLFDAGVLVTLNTDDPEMFHTTLNREYQIGGGSIRPTKRRRVAGSWLRIRLGRRSCQ